MENKIETTIVYCTSRIFFSKRALGPSLIIAGVAAQVSLTQLVQRFGQASRAALEQAAVALRAYSSSMRGLLVVALAFGAVAAITPVLRMEASFG